ncbi:MAG: histidine phosphatase family protein [Caldilineaceae bacterium]
MQLFFTRHGESQANVERIISNRNLPHSLTAKGQAQTLELAATLADQPITAIYASPILRAQETAQILAPKLGAPVFTRAALREFDCGEMEGRGDNTAWMAHEAVVAAWAQGDTDQRIPGGESFNDMRARFLPFIDQLIAEHQTTDAALLLVSHGSLLYHMLPLVLPNLDHTFIRQRGMRNCLLVGATCKAGQLTCATWDGEPV